MDNNRPTRQITLTDGTIVVLKDYVTAGEMIKIRTTGGDNELEKTKVIIEAMVVKIGESESNLFNIAMDLPLQEYHKIDSELALIMAGKKTGESLGEEALNSNDSKKN